MMEQELQDTIKNLEKALSVKEEELQSLQMQIGNQAGIAARLVAQLTVLQKALGQ